MADEGQFLFTNGTVIDQFLDKERVLDVINHEFTHSLLYATTSYGQFILMLEKNGILDDSSIMLKDALFSYMGRMQERVAVNIELMLKCIENGFDEYLDAIDSLKMRNNSYYNHFRKLCCVNGKINEESDAEKLAKELRAMARIALNVDLSQIPFSKFKTEKDVIRFFNAPANNARFSPNRRFEILVNIFFRNNENNNDYKSVHEGSISFDEMDNAEYIHDVAMRAIKELYARHPLKARLVNRVESVGVKRTALFEGAELLTVTPSRINENQTMYIKPIDSLDEFLKILNQKEKKYIYVINRCRGLEDLQAISIHDEKDNKRISYTYYFEDEGFDNLFNIIKSIDCHFVFYKTKIMNKESKSIRKMVRNLPIYMYEDTPLLSTLDVIGQMFFGGTYCFIRRDNDSVLVIQKKSIILFANIIIEAEEVLNRELKRFCIGCSEINESQKSELLYLDRMCHDYDGTSIYDAKIID